ncbi:MAG: DUF2249 domain-containing protein [Betaproteobacteria bacterium]|nr:DUF2249 domain-containing protein [Betaproteobacteria bacterium]
MNNSRSAANGDAPAQTLDARSLSEHLRHELVCEALEQLPSGATFRYIGGQYPIVLMEEILLRYGARLTYRFVESDADHVVIDLTLV